MKPNRLLVILSAAFLILAAYLAYMQIWRADYYGSLSEKNRIRILYLEAPRGRILDRRGQVMASSRLSFNCSVVPREARKTIAQSCRVVAEILGEDPKTLEERYHKRKPGVFNTVLLAEDLDPEKAMRIEERIDDLPGFMIETRPQREYAHNEAVAHLVGYIGPMTQDEIDSLDAYGYRKADWIGREGLEKSYESYLRGQSGGLQIEVDSRGRLVKVMGVKEPEDGKDIQLTVDAELQEFVQGLIRDQKGSVIVMDLDDGGILSINSSPSFDPNLFASTRGRKEVGKYLRGR
jgi:penicillin-binding protein 2